MNCPPRIAALACSLLLPLLGQEPLEPALRDVPAGALNVLLVRDVMPHVEAILRSNALRELADATQELQRELFGMQFDPATIERQLGLLRSFVPTRIEVACQEDVTTSLAHVLHAFTGFALVRAKLENGAADADLTALRKEILSAMESLQAPTGVVRVTARDERTAEQWFDQALAVLEPLADGDALTVTVGDADVAIVWRPFASSSALRDRMLERLGIDTNALADRTFTAVLAQSGAQLTLRLGQFQGADLAQKSLGELYRADDRQLVFGRLECEAALAVADLTLEMLSAHEAELESPSVLQAHALVDRCTDLAHSSTMALDLDAGASLTLLEDYGDEQIELARPVPEVVRCIDPGIGPFTLSALTLDAMLSATGDEIYSRLLLRINRPGSEERLAMLAQFDQLFDYVDGEDSAVFLPGTAFVMAGARCRGLRGVRATATGGEDSRQLLPELPFAATAIVARANSATAADAFVDALVAGICAGFQVDGAGAIVAADLGLGVPTRRLQYARWLPEGVTFDADFDPHHAQVGDVMILSSDPALTRQLLRRLQATDVPQLPVQNPIDWTRWTGAQLSATVDGLGAWLAALPPDAVGEGQQQVARICRALATIGESIAMTETLVVLEDGGRVRSTSSLTLRDQGR